MRQWTTVVLGLVALGCGCTELMSAVFLQPSFAITQATDKYSGIQSCRTEGNLSLSQEYGFSNEFYINPVRFVWPKDGSISYALEVVAYLNDWIFIERGPSLKMLVDGGKFEFSSEEGSLGKREAVSVGATPYSSSVQVTESAYYRIDEKDLLAIANAGKAEARIVGGKGYLEFDFTPENLQHFKEFVSVCIEGNPPKEKPEPEATPSSF